MVFFQVHGNYACFYKSKVSQWHMCKIKDGDITFNCAEQAMMYRKAELFNDEKSMKLILQSDSPREQQLLGRKVKNFNLDIWNQNAREIVYQNNLLRFSQNEYLKEILLSAGDLTFVEASPYDKIWGIGRGMDYPYLADRSKWLGKNWLGFTLTRVKDALK